MPAEHRTPEQRAARELTDVIVGEVLAADTIVIGMGLYNFGVPSTVKAWFDRIVVPGVTLGDEGGTLGGRTLVSTTAAGGGGYRPGTPREGWDHREPWLRHAFEQLGVSDPIFIAAELTLARESPRMIPLDLTSSTSSTTGATATQATAIHPTEDDTDQCCWRRVPSGQPALSPFRR